jgi:quinol monooxygenase YgiN
MTSQTINQTQVTVHVKSKAKAGKEQELKRLFQGLLAPSRAEKGCLNYDLHEDPKDPASFMFYENWANQEALDAHMATPHFLDFINKAEGLLATEPEITIWKMIKE